MPNVDLLKIEIEIALTPGRVLFLASLKVKIDTFRRRNAGQVPSIPYPNLQSINDSWEIVLIEIATERDNSKCIPGTNQSQLIDSYYWPALTHFGILLQDLAMSFDFRLLVEVMFDLVDQECHIQKHNHSLFRETVNSVVAFLESFDKKDVEGRVVHLYASIEARFRSYGYYIS